MRSARALAQVDADPVLGGHPGAHLAVVGDDDADLAGRDNRAVAVTAYDDRRRWQLLTRRGGVGSRRADRQLLADAGAHLAVVVRRRAGDIRTLHAHADGGAAAAAGDVHADGRRAGERRYDDTHHSGGAHTEDDETTAHDRSLPYWWRQRCRVAGPLRQGPNDSCRRIQLRPGSAAVPAGLAHVDPGAGDR